MKTSKEQIEEKPKGLSVNFKCDLDKARRRNKNKMARKSRKINRRK